MKAHNCTGISNIHDISPGMKYNEVSQIQVWGEVKVNWQKKPMRATQEPRTGQSTKDLVDEALLTRPCSGGDNIIDTRCDKDAKPMKFME